MKYPPSYYNNQARSLYESWVEGLKLLRKVKNPKYRKFHLDDMKERYRQANELYLNFHHNLSGTTVSQLHILLSRHAYDDIYKV